MNAISFVESKTEYLHALLIHTCAAPKKTAITRGVVPVSVSTALRDHSGKA